VADADGMQVEADFNRLDVEIEQRPLASWAVLAHLSIFVVTPLTIGLGAPFIGIPWFLFGALLFAVGLTWTRPVRLSVTRTDLRVDAWVGWPGKPAHVVLPLAGLELEHRTRARINSRNVYRLELRPRGGARQRIHGLACSDDELDRLGALLTRATADAQALLGEGVGEVPEALRDGLAARAAGLDEPFRPPR